MKTLLSAILGLSFVTVCSNAQELQTITENSGAVAFDPADIVQIVGVAAPLFKYDGPSYTNQNLSGGGMLTLNFADGTTVSNRLSNFSVSTRDIGGLVLATNPLQGSSFTNLTSLEVTGGAVTVKKLAQASELVSNPVMLPLLGDSVFAISIETSVDLVNWAPAAPGDYLGDTSHRYFRIKAVQQAP